MFKKQYIDQFGNADAYFKKSFLNSRLNTMEIGTDDSVEDKLLNFIIVK